jgi:hypothetical protein
MNIFDMILLYNFNVFFIEILTYLYCNFKIFLMQLYPVFSYNNNCITRDKNSVKF